jgi:hypothetical protein
MARKLTLYVTPVLAVILILIRLPTIEKFLDTNFEYATLYTGFAVAGITVLTHFITVISPFKKYEKIEKSKWVIVNHLFARSLSDEYKEFRLSGNIMVTKRTLFDHTELKNGDPEKRKIRIFGRIFKTIWTYDGKAINKKPRLTIHQGCSGQAFSTGTIIVVDMADYDTREFKLNAIQLTAIAHLKVIISCPIFGIDSHYNISNGKVIGILNVSSSISNAGKMINTEDKRRILTNIIVQFSKTCSLII